MFTKISFALAIIVAFYMAWSEGQTAYNNTIENQAVSPGDIAINKISTTGEDWITLRNNLDRVIDLHGYVFTDGDNRFSLPEGSTIDPGNDLFLASSKEEGKISEHVDYYWGDWGLSGDGELVMLINDEGNMVVDFVFTPALKKGEILERNPNGTGPMLDPNKGQPMQLQRPSYRVIPNEFINKLSRHFSTSVVSFGGLLTTISTFLINFDQTKEILEKFGLKSKM